MPSRHRERRTVGRGRFRVPVALAAVAGLVVVTAITVQIVSASASGCQGQVALNVVVTPEIEKAVTQAAQAWATTEPKVGGQCVAVVVSAEESATIASSLTVFAGRAIDVAASPQPTPKEETLPAVWIPDSTAWLRRVQVVDRSAFVDGSASIASSPVVVAMPEQAAKVVGWPAGRLAADSIGQLLGSGKLKLGIAEPRRESASLAATMLLGTSLAATDGDLPNLVRTFRGVTKTASTADLLAAVGRTVTAGPASEQAVLAHNASGGGADLVAVQVDPDLAELDYPFAVRSGVSRSVAEAADAFRAALQGDAARQAFARAGFRTPDGRQADGFPATKATTSDAFVGGPISDTASVQRALGLWTAANAASRTLALFDMTSSMSTFMSTPAGGGTRAQVMAAAAKAGLDLFTADSQVGMWAFGAQHQQVLPIGTLTPARKAEFDDRLQKAKPSSSNRSELYATLLDAYRMMRDGFDPTRPNIIVVMTDGGDSQPGGVRLEQFSQDLQKLADPTKPIRVVLIGIGVKSADAQDLQAIAQVVGGSFFPLTTPEQIQIIFLKALLQVGSV